MIKEQKEDKYGCYELLKAEGLKDTPVISVVMSVYNGSKYLCEAVESILGQTFSDFEFIVVNDGSIDDSLDILRDYQKRDPRIIIIDQKNIGLTQSLNRGCFLAAGEFVARQDADDISLPQRFQKQLGYMGKCPELAVIGSLGDVFSINGVMRRSRDSKYSRKGIKRHLANKNLFMHGSAIIRKSCLEKVGFYREFFRNSQDYDLWLRLSQHFDIDILPEYLYQYRVTAEAISVSRFRTQKKYADIAGQFHKERLKKGKDSYEQFLITYPEGLPVCDTPEDQYEYHLFLARELIGGDKLKNARRELRKLWRLGCRRREMFCLFSKSLLGVKLLNMLRRLRTLIFEMKH